MVIVVVFIERAGLVECDTGEKKGSFLRLPFAFFLRLERFVLHPLRL
ncbi:hypothetical protein O59_002973 [Cellvibrio sp. BR]|nr:hypothetical protein O59_002973 [Cellvibrio sp. BR]